jgi:hypothetical protein
MDRYVSHTIEYGASFSFLFADEKQIFPERPPSFFFPLSFERRGEIAVKAFCHKYEGKR